MFGEYTCRVNISSYLPEELIEAVDRLARERHVSRSAVIREAIESHMARYQPGAWPDAVMCWPGDPDFPRFEATRGADETQARDPFEAPVS